MPLHANTAPPSAAQTHGRAHEPCTHDHARHGLVSASRRQWAKGLVAAPLLAGPCVQAYAGSLEPQEGPALSAAAMAARFTSLAEGLSAVARIEPFTITPADLPWTQALGLLDAGQQVSFFLDGLWWFSKDHGRWLEPGFVFFARVAGTTGNSAIHNCMQNTGTLTADRAGTLQIARSVGEFASPQGELWVPLEQYLAAQGQVEGVAIVWSGDAHEGLLALSARGDAHGMIRSELQRMRQERLMPKGWHNFFAFGDGGIFSEAPRGDIACETHKNVGILQYPLADQPLRPGLQLEWTWVVDRLPSALPEDALLNHDYLSIAVEFDDGQDITYMWSSTLPVGTAFRCPIPGWNAIETHVVQRNGTDTLGQELHERCDLFRDYQRLVGGQATRVVRIWLIANSLFMRQHGQCAYRKIAIGQPDRLQVVL